MTMNSISGLSVLKKPFSWKFTKYHRFQKKIKLQIKQKEDGMAVKDGLNMNWEDEPESYTVLEVGTPPDSGIHEPTPQFCWDFDRKRKKQRKPLGIPRKHDEESEVDSDLGSETDDDAVYSTVDNNSDRRNSQYWSLPGAYGPVPLNENGHSKRKPSKHFYENYRCSSSLSSSDEDGTATASSGENADEEVDHIYDYVENIHEESALEKTFPVNVFLSLIEGANNMISPDPNIYEVPPGAILNMASSPPDEHAMRNITPPNGFKDTLTWGRLHLKDNELSSLPIDVLYSSVVKPKRKKAKRRPGLEVLKNMAAALENGAENTPEAPSDAELKVTTEDKPVTKSEADEIVAASDAEETVVSSLLNPVETKMDTNDVERATKELKSAVDKIGSAKKYSGNAEGMEVLLNEKAQEETLEIRNAEGNRVSKSADAIVEKPAKKPKPSLVKNGTIGKYDKNTKTQGTKPEITSRKEKTKTKKANNDCEIQEKSVVSSNDESGVVKRDLDGVQKSHVNSSLKSLPMDVTETKEDGGSGKNKVTSEQAETFLTDAGATKENTCDDDSESTSSQVTSNDKAGKVVKRLKETDYPEKELNDIKAGRNRDEKVCKGKPGKHSKSDGKDRGKTSKRCNKSDKSRNKDSEVSRKSADNGTKVTKEVNSEEKSRCNKSVSKQPSKVDLKPTEKKFNDNKKLCTGKNTPSEGVSKDETQMLEKCIGDGNSTTFSVPLNDETTGEKKSCVEREKKTKSKAPVRETFETQNILNKEFIVENIDSVTKTTEELEPSVAIVISDDGTWGSASDPKLTEKEEPEAKCEESRSSDFLNANLSAEEIKIKHIMTEYGNSYFIQASNNRSSCQSPKKTPKSSAPDEGRVERQEATVEQKKRLEPEMTFVKHLEVASDSEAIKEVQLLKSKEDVSETEDEAEILAKGRKCVLEKTIVRAKKRDSWIKEDDANLSADKEKTIDHWLAVGVHQLSLPPKMTDEELYDFNLDHGISGMFTKEGEIVYDSIIQNKHKTKTYWEQLMMAAEMGTQPPQPLPFLKHTNGDCVDVGPNKAHSEISENDFYDAESHNSFDSAHETGLHSLEHGLVGPKIVEKVAKKLLEAVESRPTKRPTEESVIEREIKLQRERELALVREREAAVQKTVKTLGGGGPDEILKGDTDEEWRRSRGSCKDEDPFNSIPTTDEGNYSEYGSEGKDDFSPETNNSRVMSPEVEMSGQIHQRTQSMDSMSSGHSSGSGSGLGSHLDSYMSVNARRRGNTVKPLDEPEEENISTFFRNERETPIEREIRLTREREEELRREKNNNINNIIKTNENLSSNNIKTVNSTNYSNRNSLNIEKELLIMKSEENIDVQSKVNQLNSLSQNSKLNDSKPLRLKKHLSKSVANLSCPKEIEIEPLVPSPTSVTTSNSHFKKFVAAPAPQKRGLMKRFLESRGKLGSTFTLNAPNLNSEPIKKLSTFNSSNSNQNCISVVNSTPRQHYVKKAQSKDESSCIGTRPGYKSAEEKIQNELMEMRRREEELRRQRAFSLARSQPNLLSLIDGEGEAVLDNEKEKEIEVLDRLPPMSKLRTALSNPNLLDIDEKPVQRKFQQKKRSALIAEWENRIQKNTE